jgi:hypothetical protein
MTTVTDICNLALIRARAGTIDNIEENTSEAIKCKVLYTLGRNQLLEKYPWRFAKRVKALALTANTPVEWLHEYDYPTDCLKIEYLLPQGVGSSIVHNNSGMFGFDSLNYEVAANEHDTSKVILCNEDKPYIAYTRLIEDTALFSYQFVQALAWYLASDLAIQFGGDSGSRLSDKASDEYKRFLAEATAHDANQARSPSKTFPANLAVRSSSMPQHYYENGAFYRRY